MCPRLGSAGSHCVQGHRGGHCWQVQGARALHCRRYTWHPGSVTSTYRHCQACGASPVADLTKAEEIKHMVEQAVAFGQKPIDILINNAGMQHVSSVIDFPIEV